jgi:hypothetical protein
VRVPDLVDVRVTEGVTDGVPVCVAVSLGVPVALLVSLGVLLDVADCVGVTEGHVSTDAPISRTRPPRGVPVSVTYMAAVSRYREVGPDTLAALNVPQSPTVNAVESVVKKATVPSATVTLIR